MKAKTRKQPVFLNSLAFMGAALGLSACGDGQPDTHPPEVGAFPSRVPAQASNSRSLANASEPVPLASDLLLGSLQKFSENSKNSPLTDFRMSSTLGDLPESMSLQAENLGLWSGTAGLSLAGSGPLLATGLSWTPVTKEQAMQLAAGDVERMHELQLNFDNIPVYGARLKTLHDHGSNTPTYMTGTIPRWTSQPGAEPQRVLPFAIPMNEARTLAAQHLSFSTWRFQFESRVYVPEDSETLHAAYLFKVSAEQAADGRGPHVPLEILVSADTGRLLSQRPLAFHVTGEAALYVENKRIATNTSPVALPNLVGDGTRLSHPLFDVLNCKQRTTRDSFGNSNCVQQVYSVANGNYSSITYDNETYDELVSYAAVSRAMSWFNRIDQNSLRGTWDDTKWEGLRENFGLTPLGTNGGNEKRLTIYVRTRTPTNTPNSCGENTTPDNAQYLWTGNNARGGPEILIGYGGYVPNKTSCGVLQDLGKDMDVVMHEFGHHVVFRGLSNAKNQSVAMHEGLADYFTYAITGNNLLAEYSRPRSTFLRQGNITPGTTFKSFRRNNKGEFTSVMDNLNAPHAIGEFWSGILWEIRGQMGRDNAGEHKFDKIVWDSIDLLKSDAGLYDGIIAFIESTKRYAERTGGDSAALQKIVKDAFVKYGFIIYTSAGEIAAVTELSGAGVASAAQPVNKVTKSKRWGCGDVTGMGTLRLNDSAQTNTNAWLMLILLLSPIAISVVRPTSQRIAQRLAIRVRAHRRRN